VQEELPKTLTLEQVAAVIDCQRHLRDRFLFALLASTGMRIGQALALRHEDVISWERRIRIRPRPDDARRARSKGGGQGSVPVPGELIRLWSDYMHEEYGDLDSDFVFVNLWAGEIGRQMTYRAVDDLVRRTERKVGFRFTPHVYADPVVMPTLTRSRCSRQLGPEACRHIHRSSRNLRSGSGGW